MRDGDSTVIRWWKRSRPRVEVVEVDHTVRRDAVGRCEIQPGTGAAGLRHLWVPIRAWVPKTSESDASRTEGAIRTETIGGTAARPPRRCRRAGARARRRRGPRRRAGGRHRPGVAVAAHRRRVALRRRRSARRLLDTRDTRHARRRRHDEGRRWPGGSACRRRDGGRPERHGDGHDGARLRHALARRPGPRPEASNLNVERPGQTIPNLVIVPVGDGGAVDVFTQTVDPSRGRRGRRVAAGGVGSGRAGWCRSLRRGCSTPAPARRSPSNGTRTRRSRPVAAHATGAVLNVTATEATGARLRQRVAGRRHPGPIASNLNVERAGRDRGQPGRHPGRPGGPRRRLRAAGTHVVVDLVGTSPERRRGAVEPTACSYR